MELNNPLASAEAKAEAQRELQKVQASAQKLLAEVSGAHQQVTTLPARAKDLAVKAGVLLGGVALSPPSVQVAAAPPPVDPPAVVPCEKEPVRVHEHPTSPSWWFVASGASAVAAGAGVVMNVHTKEQMERCMAAPFGCANYNTLERERDTGIVLWSAGAALSATFLTFAIINATDDEGVLVPRECDLASGGACQMS